MARRLPARPVTPVEEEVGAPEGAQTMEELLVAVGARVVAAAVQPERTDGRVVEAEVVDFNRGGLVVDLGFRGFVPLSLGNPRRASQLRRQVASAQGHRGGPASRPPDPVGEGRGATAAPPAEGGGVVPSNPPPFIDRAAACACSSQALTASGVASPYLSSGSRRIPGSAHRTSSSSGRTSMRPSRTSLPYGAFARVTTDRHPGGGSSAG
jgi:hypothetical protein